MEGGDFLELSGDARDENPLDNDYLSNKHHQGDWKFIPLVTKELELNCSIDVLFLRPDRPVDVVWGGDIDSRIKTLIDSLKVPDVNDGYNEIKPDSSDPRLFCLLEDDNLVTELRIRTDQLLEPLSSNEEKTGTFLVITVDISPYNATWSNVGFS
ncbi:hypothetical protein MNBD_ALPHA09-1036 [hydrothermal vent metagenome]|uniref:Uncharacterized protein n=1 Tax=hydrothermal vent metagenome TaxID=652676 RepID=A0A3B0TCB3_9ZZZZ